MAIVERGKGKRKQVFEIVRQGLLLRSQETNAGDERLPGYRRFASEAVAAAALAAEVQSHLQDGMQPADVEARAIAAQAAPATNSTPTLPLRADLGIYNEATGFVVTSRKMAGKELEEGSAEWKKAVQRGDMLPLTLMQDDPFVIRIVAGEPLTTQENEEWVARVDWHLNIPDGKLCVTGGSIFTNGGYDPDDAYYEQYVSEVAIPKGRYKAALYTHLHGVNGGGVMDHLAGGYDKGESIEKWFARTRSGLALPDWEEHEPVEFLLHLDPIDAAPKKGLSDLPEDGWFGGAENARKPALCPLGIEAKDVLRRKDSESGEWNYVRDVFPMLAPKWGKAEPGGLTGGGMVALPLNALSRAARISWFGSRQTVMELRLKLTACSRLRRSRAR